MGNTKMPQLSDAYTDTGDGWLRSGMVRFAEALRPLLVDIDTVTQHPENDNNGDEDSVQESILINGMLSAIRVQASTGHICAGNTTWTVCKRLDSQVIPAIMLGIDDITALRYLLADNFTARAARPDSALTLAAVEKIMEAEGSIEGTGIDPKVLERIEREATEPLDLEVDPYEGWPTFSAMVSPDFHAELMDFTDVAAEQGADGNRARLEYLLRVAKGGDR